MLPILRLGRSAYLFLKHHYTQSLENLEIIAVVLKFLILIQTADV